MSDTTVKKINTWYRRAEFPPVGSVVLFKPPMSSQLVRVRVAAFDRFSRSVTVSVIGTGEIFIVNSPSKLFEDSL